MSGVGPRIGARAFGRATGLGEGSREGGLGRAVSLERGASTDPFLDSAELVRRCDEGKLTMLLWITGDGP